MKQTTYPKLPHYHDNDTGELYRAYTKLSVIISEARNRSTRNIDDIRDICQMWIDNVRIRQDAAVDRKTWVDDIKYFFKGQLRERRSWRITFLTIAYDIIDQLDAIDGGPDHEATHTIGFGMHNNRK